MDAREVALLTLYACEKQGAWSDGHLKKAIRDAGLDSRDSALATRLCAGVLQNRMLLDFYISCFSTVKLEKMEPKILLALRLGVYQLTFMDRIPPSAAVNTAVDLARKHSKNRKATGLVNGILRAISRQESLPEPKGTLTERLAVKYSHPQWLVETFLTRLGEEETEALLAVDNEAPPIYAHVNPLKTTKEALKARLEEEGVTASDHDWLPNALILSGTGDLERLPAFKEGLFTIQDPAARAAVLAAGLKPGQRVLDMCAAPGGKSFAAAMDMEGQGEIISCDIHPHKQTLIERGAQRLGIDQISVRIQDGKEFLPEWEGAFDSVIADVPCSGLGVIRKKPEIRYKDPAPLVGLPRVQSAILENAARYVRPGGVLIYSTCTVLEGENEAVVRAFCDKYKDFTLTGFALPEPIGDCQNGMFTFWPHRHGTDGFFVAKLQRRA